MREFHPREIYNNKQQWESDLELFEAEIFLPENSENYKTGKHHIVYTTQPNTEITTATKFGQQLGHWDESLNEGYIYDEPREIMKKGNKIKSQFEIGREIEREHVDTINEIKREKNISTDNAIDMIVRDHLNEDANYYTKLKNAKLENGEKINANQKYYIKSGDKKIPVEIISSTKYKTKVKIKQNIAGYKIGDEIQVENTNLFAQFEHGSKIKQYVKGKKVIMSGEKMSPLSKIEIEKRRKNVTEFHPSKNEYSEKLKNVGEYNMAEIVSTGKNPRTGYFVTQKQYNQIIEEAEKIFNEKNVDFSEIAIQDLRADYPRKDAQWVWDNWSEPQREHFLRDHKLNADFNLKYEKLPEHVIFYLNDHIADGRYEHGTKIENEKYYKFYIDEFKNQSKIKNVDIDTYGINIFPFYGDNDSYYPPILITKTELLSLAIESFKKAHPTMDEKRLKGELNDFINFLFNEK